MWTVVRESDLQFRSLKGTRNEIYRFYYSQVPVPESPTTSPLNPAKIHRVSVSAAFLVAFSPQFLRRSSSHCAQLFLRFLQALSAQKKIRLAGEVPAPGSYAHEICSAPSSVSSQARATEERKLFDSCQCSFSRLPKMSEKKLDKKLKWISFSLVDHFSLYLLLIRTGKN